MNTSSSVPTDKHADASKATRIELLNFNKPTMRAFHMSWFAFFMCFFGWFGIAPLMAVVREDLHLTKTQIGNTIIASVAITIIARLFIGWLCDRIGPRRAYTWLLILGSIPVMTIGLAKDYQSFLLFRLAIGAIGASFVITQYHTSVMFAPNVVGTANATTAGWGNLGGGVTQLVMPLIMGAMIGTFGVNEAFGWRYAMIVPGAILFLVGIAYYFMTQDTPEGNYADLRKEGKMEGAEAVKGSFMAAVKDPRCWALFILYGACFGIELTINNVAALYFHDRFELSVGTAGLIAGLFGLMNIFARSMGGIFSDFFAARGGLKGRVWYLLAMVFCEGIALMIFSRMGVLWMSIATMVIFSLFVQMSEGATFGIVPFVNRKALGSVAGIVGAGGNAGAVLAGFLFRIETLPTEQALLYIGMAVTVASACALLVKFPSTVEEEENRNFNRALAERGGLRPALSVD